MDDLVYRLRKRAEIRRQIDTRKSVQEGKPDRIADLLEEAADYIEKRDNLSWVGLTADEIWKCNKADTGSAVEFHICSAHQNVLDFAEAIEAKLKEKNSG
jgi:hypothetical protein